MTWSMHTAFTPFPTELRLPVEGHPIEGAGRDLHLRRQLVVTKEEDHAANLLQVVFDDQVLEHEIPVRHRTALLIQADDAGVGQAREIARIDADARHRVADDDEFGIGFANGGGGFLVEGLSRAGCFDGGEITLTNIRAGQRAVDGAQPERNDKRTGQDQTQGKDPASIHQITKSRD